MRTSMLRMSGLVFALTLATLLASQGDLLLVLC